MDHRRRRLPRHCKTGVELAHGVAKGRIQFTCIIGGGSQTVHQHPERLSFDIFHNHVKLVAHTTAIDDSGQVLKTPARPLGGKQTLVCPADLSRSIDAFTDKGAERTTAGSFKVHELSCFNGRALKYTLHAIAVVAIERRQMFGKRCGQLVIGICCGLSIHSLHHSAGRRHPMASAPRSFASLFGSSAGSDISR